MIFVAVHYSGRSWERHVVSREDLKRFLRHLAYNGATWRIPSL